MTFFIYFIFITINLIALSKIFEKAGFPGWSAYIPIYNIFILIKILDIPTPFIFFYFIPLINILAYAYTCFKLAQCFNKNQIFYTIGIFFLPFVFIPILGFSRSQFTGIPLRMMSI